MAPSTVSFITLTPAAPSIQVHQTQQFVAAAIDVSGNPMSGLTFTWTSSNPAVASINSSGLASGLSAGTTTITASSGTITSNQATITVTATGGGNAAVAPTLVQHVSAGYDVGYPGSGKVLVQLPNPTQAGNAVILGVSFSGVTSLTVTDNIGTGTWVAGPRINGAQYNQVFTQVNVPAGITQITITPGAGTPSSPVSFVVSEFFNVATVNAIDVTTTTTASAPNISAGTMTTTVDGALIWMWANDTSEVEVTNVASFTKGSGFTLLSTQLNVPQVAQYQVQGKAGGITPSATVNGGNGGSYEVIALALKPATAGQQNPQAMRIVRVQTVFVPPGSRSGRFQFPTNGNLLVASWIGEQNAANCDLTAMTDGNGNTWTQAGTDAIVTGLPANLDLWYTPSATTSDTMTGPTITIRNATSASYPSNLFLYDIVGAAPAPFDVFAKTSGTQLVAGNLTTVSITPTTSNGLVIGSVMIDSHTLKGLAMPPTYLADMAVPLDKDGNLDTFAETNGYGHVNNATANTPYTFIWTTIFNNAGVGTWAASAAAFKAP